MENIQTCSFILYSALNILKQTEEAEKLVCLCIFFEYICHICLAFFWKINYSPLMLITSNKYLKFNDCQLSLTISLLTCHFPYVSGHCTEIWLNLSFAPFASFGIFYNPDKSLWSVWLLFSGYLKSTDFIVSWKPDSKHVKSSHLLNCFKCSCLYLAHRPFPWIT